MSRPTAEVFVRVNGKMSDVLARTTLTSEILADSELADLLRDLADEIERQAVNPYPEGGEPEADD